MFKNVFSLKQELFIWNVPLKNAWLVWFIYYFHESAQTLGNKDSLCSSSEAPNSPLTVITPNSLCVTCNTFSMWWFKPPKCFTSSKLQSPCSLPHRSSRSTSRSTSRSPFPSAHAHHSTVAASPELPASCTPHTPNQTFTFVQTHLQTLHANKPVPKVKLTTLKWLQVPAFWQLRLFCCCGFILPYSSSRWGCAAPRRLKDE